VYGKYLGPVAMFVDVSTSQIRPATLFEPAVEVRRSSRRRRTVSAYRQGDRVVVLIPARLTRAEEAHWVTTMVARVEQAEQRRRPTDDALQSRANDLSARYLDGAAVPASVRFVDNQRSRWGSCTPSDRTIRITSRLRSVPSYVLDYVLIHELTHLIVSDHSADFWALVDRYPMTERARGFLEGLDSAGRGGTPE
jgi:predicted metal-dependent hydrolase